MSHPSAFRRRSAAVVVMALVPAYVACHSTPEPDGYGHVEATEVVVAAQTSGQLDQFTPTEGSALALGATAAVVDTSGLILQLRQVTAQGAASVARVDESADQIGALDAQTGVAERAYARTRRLFAEQAATAQQLDLAEREYRTLVAQRAGAGAQRKVAMREAGSTDARVAQIRDQIAKSRVTNPVAGTVLTTYARTGEFVQTGQPLYKIANLDTVELRAYITEPQLGQVKIGQAATVTVDVGGNQRRTLPATVAWLSSQAEFTPTPIQTRDERTNLVYAVKIRVPNRERVLKIGMPGDVRFAPLTAPR
ncbi:MAG: HlyD family efflux transporter periplasmic adaptor subunit [Gemmatimonadaceae bacterium]